MRDYSTTSKCGKAKTTRALKQKPTNNWCCQLPKRILRQNLWWQETTTKKAPKMRHPRGKNVVCG